jgi:hypothetical protein
MGMVPSYHYRDPNHAVIEQEDLRSYTQYPEAPDREDNGDANGLNPNHETSLAANVSRDEEENETSVVHSGPSIQTISEAPNENEDNRDAFMAMVEQVPDVEYEEWLDEFYSDTLIPWPELQTEEPREAYVMMAATQGDIPRAALRAPRSDESLSDTEESSDDDASDDEEYTSIEKAREAREKARQYDLIGDCIRDCGLRDGWSDNELAREELERFRALSVQNRTIATHWERIAMLRHQIRINRQRLSAGEANQRWNEYYDAQSPAPHSYAADNSPPTQYDTQSRSLDETVRDALEVNEQLAEYHVNNDTSAVAETTIHEEQPEVQEPSDELEQNEDTIMRETREPMAPSEAAQVSPPQVQTATNTNDGTTQRETNMLDFSPIRVRQPRTSDRTRRPYAPLYDASFQSKSYDTSLN